MEKRKCNLSISIVNIKYNILIASKLTISDVIWCNINQHLSFVFQLVGCLINVKRLIRTSIAKKCPFFFKLVCKGSHHLKNKITFINVILIFVSDGNSFTTNQWKFCICMIKWHVNI